MEIGTENNSTDSCPECNGQIISRENTGELVCRNCGLVLGERNVDFTHSGKRAYTKQEREARDRTGAPISNLIPNMELTTVIDKKGIKNPDLKRAVKWDTRMPWAKRNLLIATTELKRISGNLNLPTHVKMEAMSVYRKAYKKKLLRGRSINAMVAAAIYYACRKKKVPRTLQEILDQTSEIPRDVRRSYRAIIKELKLKAPNTDPSALIPRYVAELNLNAEIEGLAIKIVKAFTENFPTSGKDPKGICAGAIYLAIRMKKIDLTQKEIADVISITEVTLRSRYKELKKKLHINLSDY
ncbi:MAG: transcription initiation factor IIB [Candidatus Lokiarchaeota archaeon]|nr:transcription initiation factor IIB [Candidatus Lokiarchaeota archaeon]MBD3201074.1 transcription initiation factor IIB [Candidatus Lokiarchaeota archaeon]